ncbi:phage tail protein [Terrarubrum flagellatum]|uniref:phage tail protein n=1 Tax=Terrirubrum flagellatum TaxID=2895980 RepID=UPI0031450478
MLQALPSNATPYMKALAAATDPGPRLNDGVVRIRGAKLVDPAPDWLPFIVYEYGLGELTPYVPSLYQLLLEGVRWQRVRGTPAAVFQGIGWLGYGATIEEPPLRRTRWNLFQLALDRVRDDEADLPRLEGVGQLSVCVRSVFWRGFSGYDIRALEYGRKKYGDGLYSSFSGVRLQGGQVKWSFGRSIEVIHEMTPEELMALDVWIEPEGYIDPDQFAGEAVGLALAISSPGFDEAPAGEGWWTFPWPEAPWTATPDFARHVAMLSATDFGTAWAVFKDAVGAVIGYRRCKAAHKVAPASPGAYHCAGLSCSPADSSVRDIYLEALTGFGDGYGATARTVGFILNAEPAGGKPPGALWVGPGELSVAGPIVASQNVNIEFGRTVRERVRAVLRF